MTQDEWQRDIAATIGSRVQAFRKQRKMSAQQLADECKRLGMEIPRSVIANFESGRRPMVTIAELLVLAEALNVAPVLILFPIESADMIEPLPGVQSSAWDAAQWFSGRRDVSPSGAKVDRDAIVLRESFEVAAGKLAEAREKRDFEAEKYWDSAVKFMRAQAEAQGVSVPS